MVLCCCSVHQDTQACDIMDVYVMETDALNLVHSFRVTDCSGQQGAQALQCLDVLHII